MPRISKVVKSVRATRIIGGLTKHFAKRGTFAVGGNTYTLEELVGIFQSQIDAIDEVDASHAAMVAAVARERAVTLRVRELTRQLKHAVTAELGFTADGWDDFGWEVPKKPGPKTVEAKLEGARKAQATRKVRHTMGKRQRKKVRGW
jgi:hypothetical protein